MNVNLGKIVVGGVASSVILWLLLQYNSRLAWLYLIILLLGVLVVYRNIVFGQFSKISALLYTGLKG